MKLSKMNLPNKITLLRILLIPFMVVVAEINAFKENVILHDITLANIIVLVIFSIASFTDFLDGHIARRDHLVTDFGKFMDPLADKLLVFAALIILIELGRMPGWIVTVIIAREFMVTGIRLLAANNNIVIAASKLGKAKTISQIVAIIALLINGFPFVLISTEVANIVCLVLTYIAALMTIVSGIDYFVKNRKIIFKSY